MDRFVRTELRRTAEAGSSLAPGDAIRLLDALDRVERAAALPREFLIRVCRAELDVDRWEASHPLFAGSRSASHPADALALASIELRRVLAHHEWPTEQRLPGSARRTAPDRAVVDALATDASGDVGDALRWSLDELDRSIAEVDRMRTERALRLAAEAGDDAAAAQLRHRRVAELAAAGVRASERSFDADGFGSAEAVGLSLPCLVIALAADRRDSWRGWRFTPGRSWYALEHRVAPRPMSRYERAVVSPVRVGADVELALRRLAPLVPEGRSVAACVAFRDLAAAWLPGIDVGSIARPLSPAWLPLPQDGLAHLCAGTADEHLDLDQLAAGQGPFGPFPGWFDLVWVSDLAASGW